MNLNPLSRREASEAADRLGWRFVLGALRASAATASLEASAALAVVAVKACGADADRHLGLHPSAGRLDLALSTASAGAVTARDVQLAEAITQSLNLQGAALLESDGHAAVLELAIDAMDIPKVRPFWAAVLGYVGEMHGGETGALVDPRGQGPAVWFQQMEVPRPQRNRLHVDVSVPHDVAGERVAAALRAGGTLVSDRAARAFWVLADAEGNEACICTWQDREAEPATKEGAADRG